MLSAPAAGTSPKEIPMLKTDVATIFDELRTVYDEFWPLSFLRVFGKACQLDHLREEEISRETPQEVQGEPGVADGDGSVVSELHEAGPQGGDQRQVASNLTAAPGAPSSASAAGTDSSPRIPLYRSDEWIWPGYIPSPGVTAIVGGINAPTTLVAIKIAATVAAGGAWPDRTRAARGEVGHRPRPARSIGGCRR